MSHSHSHGDASSHSHDHDDHDDSYSANAPLPPSPATYLYNPLDFSRILVLNEAIPGSGRAILEKGWSKHLDPMPELVSAASTADDSDDDEDDNEGEVLLYIPYVSPFPFVSYLPPFSSLSKHLGRKRIASHPHAA
jgi:hypothetical protein